MQSVAILIRLVWCTVVLFGADAASANRTYNLTELPKPLGADWIVPKALNNAGQVVGMTVRSGQKNLAYLWSGDAGLTDIGVPSFARSPSFFDPVNGTAALGINNLGDIVGVSGGFGFLWRPTAGFTQVGPLPEFSLGTAARAINDSGKIVGNGYNAFLGAFATTASGGITYIGDPPGNRINSNATAVNSSGQVVGRNGLNGNEDAFVWSEAAGLRTLSDLASSGNSWATSINDAGVIVGAASTPLGDRARMWNTLGVMSYFQVLTNGGYLTAANAINNAGVVVGNGVFENQSIAYLWTPQTGLEDIAMLVDQRVASTFRTLSFYEAVDINDSGQVLVTGAYEGNSRAVFLLTPVSVPVPEPSTYALLLAGVVTVSLMVRRRK